MAQPLGTLEVVLTSDSVSFQKGVLNAKKALEQIEKQAATTGPMLSQRLTNNMKAAQRMAVNFASSLINIKTAFVGLIAIAGAGKFIGSLDAAADTIDNLGKASKRLGISVEDLSALRFAAGESGIEFENLATMMSKAQKGIADLVSKGNSQVGIGKLNVQLTDASGKIKSINVLMPELAKGIESVSSEAEQLRLASKMFGKGGGDQFITLLKESGTWIQGMSVGIQRANRVGAIYNEDMVQKLTAYRDAVGLVQEAWLGVRVRIMTDIAPSMTLFLDSFAEKLAGIPNLIKAIGNAWGIAGSGSAAGQAASEALDEVIKSAGSLLINFSLQAGTLLVTTVSNGFQAIATTFAVRIVDALRDAMPESMRKTLGDVRVGDESKVEELLKTRARLLKQLEPPQPLLDGGPSRFNTTDRWIETNVQRILQRKGTVEEAVKVIDTMVEAERRALNIDQNSGASLIADAWKDATSSIKADAESARVQIETDMQALREALNGLTSNYGEQGIMGPPLPPPEAAAKTFPNVIAAFHGLVSQAQQTGKGISKAMGGFMADASKALEPVIAKNRAYFDSITAEAQRIRFEIYPQERLQADIARVQYIRQELIKLGQGAMLSAQDVQLAIELIIKNAEKPTEEVRIFADDIKSTIESFAADAGQAFATFAIDAEGSLLDLAKSWAKTLISMATQAMIFKPIFDSLGFSVGSGLVGTNVGNTPTGSAPSLTGARAGGGSTNAGSWYLVGERGPELFKSSSAGTIIPNDRMAGLAGSAGVTVQIIDQRSSGQAAKVTESRGVDGKRMISVLIRDEFKGMVQDGSMDKTMRTVFGLERKAVTR